MGEIDLLNKAFYLTVKEKENFVTSFLTSINIGRLRVLQQEKRKPQFQGAH